MSEQDVACGALNCSEPRQDISAEFCLSHQRQIHAFQRWLEGADERAWPGAPSFDFERNFWGARQRPA